MTPEQMLSVLQKSDTFTLCLLLLFFSGALLANILYYRTLSRTMSTITPSLRPFPPGTIWLAFLPFIGTLWYMVYVVRLSLALQRELVKRQLPGDGAIRVAVSVVLLFLLCLVPSLRLYAMVPTLAMWIMHWYRISRYHKLLAEPNYLEVE